MNRFALITLLLAGCASHQHAPGKLRFRNADPVTKVNDQTPIASPEKSEQGLVAYYLGEDLISPLDDALTVGDPPPAANVNSLGEVPDSAWFTNRQPTPEEIEHGPGAGGPDRSQPWRVVGVKIGGAAIGIMIEDATNAKYVLKFDEAGHPETETAADVIVQRLAWAFGYNVPENDVVSFTRSDLVLDPKAEFKDRAGNSRPMTQADLDKYLGMVDHEGASYRGLVSKFIDGTPIGGIRPKGTRAGDPNDRVPHELRRDLRGQRVLWAWVNHPDIKTQNSLATYTEDKYVRWYTLDFGESLGVGARTTGAVRLGYRRTYQPSDVVLSLVTFGFYVHPWERQEPHQPLRGLGYFDAASFDPAGWTSSHNWRPVDLADKHDELWATEILLRLTPAHVAAAVAAGKYSDPRTAAYVTSTLIARQQKLGRYAFSRVAPLVAVRARGTGTTTGVCFSDLWLKHAFGPAATTTYRASAFDYDGRPLGELAPLRAIGPESCIDGLALGASHDAYTIVRLDVRRDDDALPAMFVHLARGPSGMRVVGLDRR